MFIFGQKRQFPDIYLIETVPIRPFQNLEYFQIYVRQKEKDVRNVLGEYAGSILGLVEIEKTLTL